MFADTKAYSGFAVDDVPKAREFYGDTLGLKTSEEIRPVDAAPRR